MTVDAPRDKLLLIGTRPHNALRGDVVKVIKGSRQGQLIEVKKIITEDDRYRSGRTVELILGTKGEIVPVTVCEFYTLRTEKRPSDFKKKQILNRAS